MNYKHGHAKHVDGAQSQAYRVWAAMKRRCYNPNTPAFSDYGGRGIGVCERWHDFANFLSDMGEPTEGMTLDRADNSGGYSPENCRWATRKTQARNRRGRRVMTAFGETKTMAEWSDATGVSISTLWARVSAYGWSAEKAVSTKVDPTRRHRAKKVGAENDVKWSEPAEIPGWVR